MNNKSELLTLKNVGKATLEDFHALGIYTIEQLAQQDPTELYERLALISGVRHDPCVWDVFAATIHEAQTGQATDWFAWTAMRKEKYPFLKKRKTGDGKKIK